MLLLSRDEVYTRRGQATVAPITRTMRSIPSHVHVGTRDGLQYESDVDLDSLVTVDLRRLDRVVASLSAERMRDVEEAIRFGLDLPAFER